MSKRNLLFLGLFLAFTTLVLSLGCGKGSSDPTVATVGQEDIPVSVITNFFDKIGATFTSADEEFRAKRDALDSLIDYKLMVKGAYDAGLDRDNEVNELVNSEKSGFMFDELYRQEIVPIISVSDKEVDEFYDKMKVEYHLAHILVATEREADSVAAELQKGVDFGSIARAVSLDQASAVKGGDLGFVSWAADVDKAFHNAAFSLSVGQTSKPVKSAYGWHVIRMLETRDTRDLQSKDEIASGIRETLKGRKSREAEAEFLKRIEDKAKVEINTEATQMLMDRLNQFYPKQLGTSIRPDNYFPQTDLLKPFELQMVLASYQGGEVTVEDYLKKIGEVPQAYRPRFNDVDSLKKVIFQLELRNIMEYEAAQRNVEDKPEFQRRMADFREGIMADRFVRSVLSRSITVDEDEIRQYYNSHLEEFLSPRELHLQEIEVGTVEEASRLLDQIKAGADFSKLAAQNTIRPGYRERQGDLGFVQQGRYPNLYDVANRMSLGQVSSPIQNEEGKYSIVKLVDTKESVARPVEEIAGQVKEKVMSLKRSSATADWLKQQRAKTTIKVNEDVLRESIDRAKYEKKG